MDSASQTFDDVSPASGAPMKARRAKRVEATSLVDDSTKRNSIIFSPKLMVSAAIVRPNRIFRLRGTFVIDSQQLDDGTIFVRHRELPVYGYGETFAEALDSFGEMFDRQWSELVEDRVENLADPAVEVSAQLRRAVEQVIQRR